MNPTKTTAEARKVGDFAELIAQLDAPSETISIASGYTQLMARLNSAEYRRRCGLITH